MITYFGNCGMVFKSPGYPSCIYWNWQKCLEKMHKVSYPEPSPYPFCRSSSSNKTIRPAQKSCFEEKQTKFNHQHQWIKQKMPVIKEINCAANTFMQNYKTELKPIT